MVLPGQLGYIVAVSVYIEPRDAMHMRSPADRGARGSAWAQVAAAAATGHFSVFSAYQCFADPYALFIDSESVVAQ